MTRSVTKDTGSVMDRQEIVTAALWPADRALEAGLELVEKMGVLEPASDLLFAGLQRAWNLNFTLNNDLEVEGAENVPRDGGVLLACNHQSWLDVQVIGAAAPRRVHFIAKSELQTWPVLRHLVKLSQSVFIHRGGDEDAMNAIVEDRKSVV